MLDTLYTGGKIRTFDPEQPWAEALGVTGDTITYVGPSADAPAARHTVQLEGRLVTPGVADTHNHLLLGFDDLAVSLDQVESLDVVRSRIAEFAETHPELEWICAENALYSVVEGRRPNADDLVGVTDKPVFITTYDQHSVWLNRPALAKLGILNGAEIAWGKPERDSVTGEPTGWITDFYTSAMTISGLAELQRDIPMYSPDRRYRKVTNSLDMAARFGITTVVEPQVPLAELDLFARANDEGKLTSRTIAAIYHPVGADGDFRARITEAIAETPQHERFKLGPVKLYADDVIEPHTAAMLEDYANRPGHRGHTSLEPTEFTKLFIELDRLGYLVHTHAIGDWGTRLTLDSIEAAQRANGTRSRHGIVHVECLAPDDLPRFAELGVVAAMQPRHASPDLVAGTWMENVGEQRWDRAWRYRSLIESGAKVTFSSDWQVGEMDPLVGVYSAMTRARLDGSDGWTQGERLDLDRTLHAYTQAGAFAFHQENKLGMLRAGYLADLVVWSGDLYAMEPAEILQQSADLTVVRGEAIHDSHGEQGGPQAAPHAANASDWSVGESSCGDAAQGIPHQHNS
ncbi:amidohydrolase [Leucobacter sp. UCMA 4100]|uniref:amidohydrolase n=1 Tax=Leucobacter sp. UCMA 4100 TaxID=2810534 RepID=UPI0022EA1A43|nr:amidohydrolase [Leucobacter sp. UCMA 4100]MDA3148183.1 amidohydrolase [Leucobacter sp. UCMA 4100]